MLERDQVLQKRYRVVRSLGRGGMGAVYEAVDEHFHENVALKEALVTDPKLAKAFEREARLLRTLRHSALPGVIDYFSEGDSWYLVMDYVPGEDFAALAERRAAPFPIADVLGWGDQILDVLDYLHTHEPPIIHRDVKPQNLKLTPAGRIVLLDFGLSKGFKSNSGALSGHHSIFGYTPHFAPLEQIRGAGTDSRSDIYAAAATLWALATGIVPPDALQRAGAVAGGEPDPLRPAHEIVPAISEPVSRVLQVALAQSPDQRPQTAAVLRRLLRDAISSPAETYATKSDSGGTQPITVAEGASTAPFVPASSTVPVGDPPRGPATVAVAEPERRSNRGVLVAVVAIVLIAIVLALVFMFGAVKGSGEQAQPRKEGASGKQPSGETTNATKSVTVDLVATAMPDNATQPFGDSGVRIGSGSLRMEPIVPTLVAAPGTSHVLFLFGPGFAGPYGYHVAEVTIDGVASSVTLTRPGVRNNASTPAWQVQALDAKGAQVGAAVGEGDIGRGSYLFPTAPQDFTIAAPGIKRLRFASNNNQSTFGAVPFTRISVTLER